MMLEERNKGVMEINRMLEEGIQREKTEEEEKKGLEDTGKGDGEENRDECEAETISNSINEPENNCQDRPITIEDIIQMDISEEIPIMIMETPGKKNEVIEVPTKTKPEDPEVVDCVKDKPCPTTESKVMDMSGEIKDRAQGKPEEDEKIRDTEGNKKAYSRREEDKMMVVKTKKQCRQGKKCDRPDCYFQHPGEEEPRAYRYINGSKSGKNTTKNQSNN